MFLRIIFHCRVLCDDPLYNHVNHCFFEHDFFTSFFLGYPHTKFEVFSMPIVSYDPQATKMTLPPLPGPGRARNSPALIGLNLLLSLEKPEI